MKTPQTSNAPDRSKKKEKWTTKIKNERGDLTTNSTRIKRIRSKCYEQLYANKLDNLEKFLDTQITETDSRRQKISIDLHITCKEKETELII